MLCQTGTTLQHPAQHSASLRSLKRHGLLRAALFCRVCQFEGPTSIGEIQPERLRRVHGALKLCFQEPRCCNRRRGKGSNVAKVVALVKCGGNPALKHVNAKDDCLAGAKRSSAGQIAREWRSGENAGGVCERSVQVCEWIARAERGRPCELRVSG